MSEQIPMKKISIHLDFASRALTRTRFVNLFFYVFWFVFVVFGTRPFWYQDEASWYQDETSWRRPGTQPKRGKKNKFAIVFLNGIRWRFIFIQRAPISRY